MQRLPIDTSTFSRLRELDYLYVDKTEHIYRMLTTGHRFFLSRPRRFGKSLLVSTMKAVLTGNKELFHDLWIGNSDYDWNEHGVINLDFSKIQVDTLEIFEKDLIHTLAKIAKSYNVDLNIKDKTVNIIFEDLVDALFARFKRVAVLIDEYDSPIIHTLANETLALQIRDRLQKFFSAIKSLDKEIDFVFITGVSSFAKAGLSSGINNLQMLTLQDDYVTICGYTDQEIDHYFSEHVTAWSEKDKIPYQELRQKIKEWYNGYHFGENVTAVYNPFSLMNALDSQKLDNFQSQSAIPILIAEILKKKPLHLNHKILSSTENTLNTFDLLSTPLTSAMFQAGYLTIVHHDPTSGLYTLDYPNEEVRVSFQKYLLEIFADSTSILSENHHFSISRTP
jgi:hypothetical protein